MVDESAPMPERGFRARLLDTILPPSWQGSMLMGELPEGYEDCIGSEITIHLGLRDRIRVLFHGHVHVGIFNFTENKPGGIASRSWGNTA